MTKGSGMGVTKFSKNTQDTTQTKFTKPGSKAVKVSGTKKIVTKTDRKMSNRPKPSPVKAPNKIVNVNIKSKSSMNFTIKYL